jgi:hypothetical protein
VRRKESTRGRALVLERSVRKEASNEKKGFKQSRALRIMNIKIEIQKRGTKVWGIRGFSAKVRLNWRNQ